MIKIINKKPEMPDKESTYHVYINDEFICEFKYKRAEGLNKCLMEAVREIGHYHYDLLKKRVSFIYPETGKPLKGNNCGTMIVYFWREIDVF
jgi:hypothetical protein